MMHRIWAAGVAIGALAAASPAMAECSRADLKIATDRYVAAQSTGDLTYMPAMAGQLAYSENEKAMDIKAGMLAQPLKIDHHRSLLDSAQCATYTEVIVTDPAHPYVIGTQMWFTDGKISRMDSIVTDKGDWLFSARHTLKYALTENWGPIAPDQRDSRATIKAAADSYLNLFNDPKIVVPWGTPCARLEGGLYTGKGLPTDSCNVGVPSGIQLLNRRYVFDETVGAVDVFLTFGGASGGLPDSHEYRVEKGRIRFVHTITACATDNCGFPPPEQLKDDR